MSSSSSPAGPALPCLEPRQADSHKGNYGRLLVIGGSRGMAGAVALTGRAALRSGAGLVTIATSDACLETVAGFEPSYMTIPLDCDARGRIAAAARSRLESLLESFDVLACGPGLGRSADLDQLIGWLYLQAACPLVLDADGLNALATRDTWGDPTGPRILTPHPGEFRRLLGSSEVSMDELPERADEFAGRRGVTLVLKGHRTRITDGRRVAVNSTGNPGMATGGSGDVLTGVIAGLLGQGLEAFAAAQLAVHVHGLAGDLAAAERGQVGLISSDLLDFLPPALRTVGERGT